MPINTLRTSWNLGYVQAFQDKVLPVAYMNGNRTDGRKRAGSSSADDGVADVAVRRNRNPGATFQENRIVRDSIDLALLVI
jgi:hypothetical protein